MDGLKNFVQSTPFKAMKLEKLKEIFNELGEGGLSPQHVARDQLKDALNAHKIWKDSFS